MIYKFISNTETIVSHKAFIEKFKIKKHELYTLMKQNPFIFNGIEFTHEPIIDKDERKALMPHLYLGRPKGKSTSYKIETKVRNQKQEERVKSIKEPYYYEQVGQWMLKKSSTTHRLISSSFTP